MDTELLATLGITPDKAFSTESLVTLRKAYVEAVESAKEEISSSDDTIKEVVENYGADEGLTRLSAMFKSQLLTLIYDYLLEPNDENDSKHQGDMRFSVLLFEILTKEVAPIVKYERDSFLASENRKNNTTKEVDLGSFEEKKGRAEELGKAIRTLFDSIMTIMPSLLQDAPLKPKKIEGFPMEVSKPKEYKSGKKSTPSIIPDLPKVPWVKSPESATGGRPVTGSHMELYWNGELVFPSSFCNTPLDVVNKFVSDRQNGIHYTWKGIMGALEETGKNIMKDDWKMEIPDRGVLEGKVKKSEG